MAVFNTLRQKGQEAVDALKSEMQNLDMEYQMAQDEGSPLPALFSSREEYDTSRRIGLVNPVSTLLAKAGPAPTAKLYQEQIRPAVTQAFSQIPAFTPTGKIQKGIVGMGGQFLENMFRGFTGGSPERYQQDIQLSQNLQAGTPTQADLEALKRLDTEFMTEFGTMAGTLTPVPVGFKNKVLKGVDLERKIDAAINRGDKEAAETHLKTLKNLDATFQGKELQGVPQTIKDYEEAINKLDDIAEGVGKTDLLSEAKKAIAEGKSAEEFIDSKINNEYAMSHRPSEGVRAFDLTEKVDGENMIPKDMYERWYGSRGTESDLESISALKKVKGKPDADITIYRASPEGSFNYGDWVTFSEKYAKQHAEGQGGKVFSKKVKAKDVKWAMDDINEFGYYPENYKAQLTDIWNKAKKLKKGK